MGNPTHVFPIQGVQPTDKRNIAQVQNSRQQLEDQRLMLDGQAHRGECSEGFLEVSAIVPIGDGVTTRCGQVPVVGRVLMQMQPHEICAHV
jgi:hypothetical protein